MPTIFQSYASTKLSFCVYIVPIFVTLHDCVRVYNFVSVSSCKKNVFMCICRVGVDTSVHLHNQTFPCSVMCLPGLERQG